MASNPPFSQPGTDLLPNYSGGTSGVAGDYKTTIPTNFSRTKSAILELHSRLSPLEAQNAVTADNIVHRAGINENFSVARVGEAMFNALAAGATVAFVNSPAFLAGSSYTGGRVAAVGVGTYNYIQSLFPGWMMAQTVFTNTGEVVSVGSGRGAKFTFNGAMAYSSHFGTGVLAGAGGDFPGLYQVTTRQIPIESIQGKAVTVRMRYNHTGAIAAGNEYKLYIAYVDNAGVRQEALSAALVSTTAETVVSFSTGDSLAAAAFVTGVVPSDATSVEVGFALTANSGAFANDPWDIFELSTTIGTQRAESAPLSLAQDFLETGAYYSQPMGVDSEGAGFSAALNKQHPLLAAIIANGGAAPATALADTVYKSSWSLFVPWRVAGLGTIDDVRSIEFTGGVCSAAAAIGYMLQFGVAPDNAVAVIDGVSSLAGSAHPSVAGIALSVLRKVTILPSGSPGWIDASTRPELTWQGELACALAPLNA